MLVVLPFCNKDVVAAERVLEWTISLDKTVPHTCLLAYERGTEYERVTELANRYFKGVVAYQYDKHIGPPKWPHPQNYAFQTVARWVYDFNGNNTWKSFFWWEPDATPLKPGWLKSLEDEYTSAGKPFMGSVVDGFGYMAGVGIYPWNVCDYTTRALLCRAEPWDMVMRDETSPSTHRANHLIQHVRSEEPFVFENSLQIKETLSPSAVLFHRCKDGSLIDGLRGKLGSAPKLSTRRKKSTCLIQLGRYGDILNILPVAREIAETYDRPKFMVAQEFASILDGVSYVDPVIFGGHYGNVKKAIQEAECFDHVIVSQAWGNDGWAVERTCDSYNQESWKLAGFLDRWKDRNLRLLFDRRDSIAEGELLAKHLRPGKQNLLLNLGTTGSSPFSKALPVQQSIIARWSHKYNVVDLSTIKARRIYDLLCLYSGSPVLVSTDTATLHLANASKIKVVALVNDLPWLGTIPRMPVALTLKYSEVESHIEEIHDVIASL